MRAESELTQLALLLFRYVRITGHLIGMPTSITTTAFSRATPNKSSPPPRHNAKSNHSD